MAKRIHQIYISDDDTQPGSDILGKIHSLKSLYSDYDYTLWNNQSITDFLSENFSDEVLKAYHMIKPYAFKADLARYCILYKLGGYYIDIAVCPEVKFEPKTPVMFRGNSSKQESGGLDIIENNIMFFPTAGNTDLKLFIDKSVQNILELNYGDHPLDITSPIMLGRLETNTITYGSVDVVNNRKAHIFNDDLVCFFKSAYMARQTLNEFGCEGTNDYAAMYFNQDVFNFAISYVIITHDSADLIFNKEIKAIKRELKDEDEIIVVGNIDHIQDDINIRCIEAKEYADTGRISIMRNMGINAAVGDIIITMDNDVLIGEGFRRSVEKYLKNNQPAWNTRMILPNGGRWWDRIAIDLEADKCIMKDYDYTGDDLIYVTSFIIRKRWFALKYLFHEELNYYEHEDTIPSRRAVMDGYPIITDTDTIVFHADNQYLNVINNSGEKVVIKKKDHCGQLVLEDAELSKRFRKLVKVL